MEFSFVGLFGAGLLTFITPCVLPLVPIYLSALIGGDVRQASGAARGQLMLRALIFTSGFVAVFTLMGLTASATGAFLAEYKAVVQGAAAVLILLFGLKFVGLIHIPLFDRIVRADDRKLQTSSGALNAFVMGVVFAAGWSPCVGPVLGSVLTYTAQATSDPLTGASYLALYGAGFATPMVLTAAFAEAGVRFLKRINPHLPRIEFGIGALMLVVAFSLFMNLAAPVASVPTASAAECQGAVSTVSVAPSDAVTAPESEPWPKMVELYRADCAVCQRMKPVVEGIVNSCHGYRVSVRQVDVSEPENKHLAAKYRLVGVPTFIFLDRENQEVARLVGEQSEQALLQALSALRGEPCPGVGSLPEDHSSVPAFPLQKAPSSACKSDHTGPDTGDVCGG